VRTLVATDGVAPDEPPYVRSGHDALLGLRLKSIDDPADVDAGSCVTGGCHLPHNASTHPMVSDVPGAEFWP
jgi:hypothetical protein